MAALSPDEGNGKSCHVLGLFAGTPPPSSYASSGFHVGLGRRGDLSRTGCAIEARGFEADSLLQLAMSLSSLSA